MAATIYYTTNIHARKKTDSQSEDSITEQEDLNLGNTILILCVFSFFIG